MLGPAATAEEQRMAAGCVSAVAEAAALLTMKAEAEAAAVLAIEAEAEAAAVLTMEAVAEAAVPLLRPLVPRLVELLASTCALPKYYSSLLLLPPIESG